MDQCPDKTSHSELTGGIAMYTYIVIDDEKLIRKGTIKKLQPMEDRITCIGEADNGQSGIQLIQEVHPDFVILDMQMPVMGGRELLPYLAENYPDMPLIVISGYRDFDYVKQAISADAIDYILKPFSKEAIQECVSRALERLEDNQTLSRRLTDSYEQKEAAYYEYDIQYLTNLILGYHTGEGSVSSDRLKFINDTHRLILLTLYFESSAETQHINVQSWLEDGGFGDLALYLPNPSSAQMGFLVLFMPNTEVIHSHRLVDQISSALTDYAHHLGTSLRIGVSQSHADLSELHAAFTETSEALNQQSLILDSQSVYYYRNPAEPKPFVWEQEEEFLFRVEAGMTEEVQNLTVSLFRLMASSNDFTLADAKYYCYHLSGQCRGILNYYLKQDTQKNSNSIQNVVNYIFSLNELKEYYRQFFLNISGLLKNESIYAGDDVVEKIQTYMQHNYQKNLTQDFIASLFYLNRSYLSTLFRQKTGMKFIDYLNEIRIEKSKELLRDSSRKMYQISKAVGYDNSKYFFRIFKKKTGMTPEQYRELV